MATSVYKLESALIAQGSGFVFRDSKSFFGHQHVSLDFTRLTKDGVEASRLSSLWTPREVDGSTNRGDDFTDIFGVPAFSQNAVEVLGDLLRANGEILPLITPPSVGPFFAYNTTTFTDALDAGRADVNGYVAILHHYEFRPERLDGLSIFRIRECPPGVYVTDEFVSRARAGGLQGLPLAKIWPLKPGENWFELAVAQKMN